MPVPDRTLSNESTRRMTSGDYASFERDTIMETVEAALEHMDWPATRSDVKRTLANAFPTIPEEKRESLRPNDPRQTPLAGYADKLPKRKYESAEDVKYTLDALGAFPEPTRHEG